MKVLVLGASGFIGNAVTLAFVRAGHIVYGQTRDPAVGKELSKEEVIPILCDPYTDEGKDVYAPIAKQVDVFVDCLKSGGADKALGTLNHFLSLVQSRPKAGPKPTYIYCGGLWSWSRGSGGLESWTDERQPRSGYNPAVAWREKVEEPLLLDERIYGTVIRASMLYGRSGSHVGRNIFEVAFQAATNGNGVFETLGKEDTRLQTIHADDLAELFVRVGERGPICRGQTFLGANPQSESLLDLLNAVTRVSGCKGYKLSGPKTPYDDCWVSTLNLRPSLGYALTGWQPRKMSLVDSMDTLWTAYLAHRE
ncbi:hypothetical protein TREMEDRAFT_60142 [Tremella mesenterica DSM 1558]|uniref:uncharacterized protein n=1 Tax=Tremella mesenterica (strain ATCC 24925 / CBS 8224 / DSM 1558 / NBRC 9311 / NRRL Y-6157 / RJB 2259-6 / UBC 559-6) TaxID=578456 RepID=UPI0003F49D81|nr:uncharacterized protein TREMEDRAFT_60142 [Tremella mesenterica DSM 1558]EIW71209.1 hypothetical protein TREMEDRAFT_60142 [Tremella mesenterica DSM 1558]